MAVLLDQTGVCAHPGEGYEPLSGHIKAIEFLVNAASPEAACEIAYGITNSNATELHCASRYRGVVETYREIGHFRSVSVNDFFVIDGMQFVCARFGFLKVPTG